MQLKTKCVFNQARECYGNNLKISHMVMLTWEPTPKLNSCIIPWSQFLHYICNKVLLYNIPDKLIINTDQTPSKYVATNNVTMAIKWEKYISRTGSNDKRSITLTLCKSHIGAILPFQLICKEKQQDHCQILIFLTVFPVTQWKTLEQWNWDHLPH